jgi:hypothetical protein
MLPEEKLQEILERHGCTIHPMPWQDGSVSYGIYKNGKPWFPISDTLKKEIEANVPHFSHFGMGDVVHLD